MRPSSVELIWALLLLVVYAAALPLAVVSLHRLWRAARGIELYFLQMAEAAEGIGRGTTSLTQLEETIQGAGVLLETAGALQEDAETIRKTLESRVSK